MSSDTNDDKITQIKERFLECGICNEEYDEALRTPRLLPCLHTLCSDCIQKSIHNSRIECPFCRVKHNVIPTKGTENFAKDNTRRDLLTFIGAQDRGSAVLCKACDDRSTAKYRCKNCADFLCEQCYKAHRRTKYTKDHRILRLEELKFDPELMKEFIYEGFCKVTGHETVPLKLYCVAAECCKPICYNCAVSEHRDPTKHPVQNIVDVYEAKKQNLESSIEHVKIIRPSMLDRREKVDRETAKVQLSLVRVEREIDEAFSICIQMLENRKIKLKQKANEITRNKKYKLENQSRLYSNYIERLVDSLRFTEETLLYKDVSGLLEIEDTINRRLQELQQEEFLDEPHTNTELEFQKIKMSSDFESFCNQMGNILSTEAYPPNTKIMIPKPVQEGEESSITVNLFTSTREPVTNKELELEIEITDSSGVYHEKQICRLRKEKEYKMSFKPTSFGLYCVTIRSFGGKLVMGTEEFKVQQSVSPLLQGKTGNGLTCCNEITSTFYDGVFDVAIDLDTDTWPEIIRYKHTETGQELQRQKIHGECSKCNSILVLLQTANKTGILFQTCQQSGGNEVVWNKNIPFTELIHDISGFWSKGLCADYLKQLKTALAVYGID